MKQINSILVASAVMVMASCSTADEMAGGPTDSQLRSSVIPVIIGVNGSSYSDSVYTETLPDWSNSGTRSEADAAHGTDNSNTANNDKHRDGKLSTLMVGDRFNVHFISGVTTQLSRYRIDRALAYEDPDASMTDPSGTLTDEEYRKQHARVKRAIAVAETMVNGVADASNPQPFFLDGATTAYCRAYYPAMNPVAPALWTVERDQSTIDGVRKSDLMFAEGTADASLSGAATPATTIQMAPFKHRMSRLRVTLFPTILTSRVKKIEIVGGAYRQVNILDTEKLITGNDLRVPCTESESILMCPEGNYSEYMDYAVLLPAQVLCQQTVADTRVKLLRITLVNNTKIEVEMAPKKILAGKTYTINLGTLYDELVGQTISLGSWNETQTVSYQYSSGSTLTNSSKGLYQVGNTTFRMLNVEAGNANCTTVGKYGADTSKGVDMTTHKSYLLGETETTQALWRAAMGDFSTSLDYAPSSYGDDLPIYGYNWSKLKEFFQNLNTMTGPSGNNKRDPNYYFTLPTEAEWRYAAQGGIYSNGYTYVGGNNIDVLGWYAGNSGGSAQPVAKLRPNELGLYDMGGNYWELLANYQDTDNNRKAMGGVFGNGGDAGTWQNPWTSRIFSTKFGPTRNAAWGGRDLGFRIALIHQDDMQDCQKFAIPGNTTNP